MQDRAPLWEAVRDYVRGGPVRLHVPAHQGRALPEELAGEDLLALDVTEVPGLDDLHRPTGPIARAQELTARLFGVPEAYFLVQGSTVGLQALLLAAAGPDEEIVLERTVHRAVWAGLILSGARPIFLPVRWCPQFNIPLPPAPDQLRAALARHPGVRAVLFTHPNYYGVAADVGGLVAAAGDRAVLVDEAHGVHLAFHPELPRPAMAAGAEASVQSTHKLGGALTQGAWLLLRGRSLNGRRVARVLDLLQTTSPSYLLMISLDLARKRLALHGRELLARVLGLARDTAEEIAKAGPFAVLREAHLAGTGCRLDETKLVINVRESGRSGWEVAGLLRSRYNVQVEMADRDNIVAVLGPATRPEDCAALVRGLRGLAWEAGTVRTKDNMPTLPPVPPLRLLPRAAWLGPRRAVSLREARGQVSADLLAVHPPGVPAVGPGEEFTPEILEYLEAAVVRGLSLHGAADPRCTSVEIVAS
ncbi:MAG: aminotransferase class I/II-fold pyridoxal phosphate-dependent enzyme [Desulfotomaculales bacterium]